MNAPTTHELKIVTRPAFTVAGLLLRGQPGLGNFAGLWDLFGPRMDAVPNAVNLPTSYGVCKNMDMATNEFDYMAVVEVSSTDGLPADLVTWDVPAADYAVFPTTLPTLGEAYGAAEQAIPAAGYERGMYDLEVYPADFDPSNPQAALYLYIPVRKL